MNPIKTMSSHKPLQKSSSSALFKVMTTTNGVYKPLQSWNTYVCTQSEKLRGSMPKSITQLMRMCLISEIKIETEINNPYLKILVLKKIKKSRASTLPTLRSRDNHICRKSHAWLSHAAWTRQSAQMHLVIPLYRISDNVELLPLGIHLDERHHALP